MKLAVAALMLAALTAPAFAQASGATQLDTEGKALLDRYVVLLNKGDVPGLTKEVYAAADAAALEAQFKELRADSFGKLEAYSAGFCSIDADRGRAVLKFARIYTFGGKMNDDEAKVFDLVKTPAGWRIAKEAEAAFDTVLSC
jgi:hypothetical protein